MCLTVYRDRNLVPSGVRIVDTNDSFFDARTNLRNTTLEKEILKTIDKAECSSPLTFIGRDKRLGSLNKSCLSTGSKTLLNIISNPDVCFDVCECGNNALKFLPKMRSGIVLWKRPFILADGNEPCDIEIDGRHFTDLYSFLSYCYYDEEE